MEKNQRKNTDNVLTFKFDRCSTAGVNYCALQGLKLCAVAHTICAVANIKCAVANLKVCSSYSRLL